jgi:hypothetical protein
MAQKMITGYTPPGASGHIYAADDAQMHRGLFTESGILESDLMLACAVVDNNNVQLASGMYSNQGYLVSVPGGSTETLPVFSGTEGLYRKDLIVADFERGAGEVADTHEITVVSGEPAVSMATAEDPTLIQQDLTAGGVRRQEALYRIVLYGLQIISVERLARIVAAHGQMPITPLPASLGTITLAVNTIYSGALTGATTFVFPTPTPTLQNQIMIHMTVNESATVTWPANCLYVASVAPTIREGKFYRVVIEYDPLASKWMVGAIESGEVA